MTSHPPANHCFACGPDNPIGLKLDFRLDGDLCVAEFTPGTAHVGFHEVVHGGLLFTALDDVMANWLFLQQMPAFTGKANVRYRREGRVGETLRLEGWCEGQRRRAFRMCAKAVELSSGDVICEADATFMRLP